MTLYTHFLMPLVLHFTEACCSRQEASGSLRTTYVLGGIATSPYASPLPYAFPHLHTCCVASSFWAPHLTSFISSHMAGAEQGCSVKGWWGGGDVIPQEGGHSWELSHCSRGMAAPQLRGARRPYAFAQPPATRSSRGMVADNVNCAG